MQPLLDLRDDLGIELCVVGNNADERKGLEKAFDGVDVAVLLSAAHAEFLPAATTDKMPSITTTSEADALVPGSVFQQRAVNAYKDVASAGVGINVLVPPVAGAAAARRLHAEVAAVASVAVRHVVLRSSMGVSALTGESDGGREENASAVMTDAGPAAAASITRETAVARMGGAAAIASQVVAEGALRGRCAERGMTCTVLRLGALVDSAGGVPLAFGKGDGMLLQRADEGEAEPPLISRNDAARLVSAVVCSAGLPSLAGATVDVAWQAKWGITSAGTEEAARTAARQDLVAMAVAGAGAS